MIKTITGRPVEEEKDDDRYVPLTRPRKRSSYAWIWATVGVLLFLGVATVVFNPFNLRIFRPYALFHLPVLPDEVDKTLRDRVKRYYTAVESRNFDSIQPFFAPQVEYYGTKHARPKPDILASYQYTWKNIAEERHELHWETFKFEHDTDSTYKVFIQLHYNIKNKRGAILSKEIPAYIRFNGQFQIFYISNKNEN
jgi:hypothetical protein